MPAHEEFIDREHTVHLHDDQGPTLVAVSSTLLGLATLFLALRVWCKFTTHRGFWWDDWILLISWVAVMTETALAIYTVKHFGYGRHTWGIPPQSIDELALVLLIRATFAPICIAWTKTAFAFTLLRITDGWMRKIVWGIIISMNVLVVVAILLFWLPCTPLEKRWTPSMKEGTCLDQISVLHYHMFTSSYWVAMDFTLAFLPWKIIYGLLMNTKEKIGIGIAMSMGVTAAITGIVKTVKLPNLTSPDLYDSADLAIWDIAEAATTIIAACIPVLRILVRGLGDTTNRQYGGPRIALQVRDMDARHNLSTDGAGVRKPGLSSGGMYGRDERCGRSDESIL